MRFKEPKFERRLEKEEERREGEKKLEQFIGEVAIKTKLEGAPVDFNCRIDMEEFKDIYSRQEIEKDQQLVREWEEKWQKEGDNEKIRRDGEKLEMLKTAIFHKFLSKDFIVARSSSYDDIKNKIDNVVLKKESGNPVCALDEVAEISGPRLEIKKERVLKERNIKEAGGKLKYGLKMEKDEKGQRKIVFGKIEHLPVFYLPLDKQKIEEGIKNFIPSLSEKSRYEEKLWNYFTAVLNAQVQFLKLEPNLDPLLKDRLSRFQKDLEKFKK